MIYKSDSFRALIGIVPIAFVITFSYATLKNTQEMKKELQSCKEEIYLQKLTVNCIDEKTETIQKLSSGTRFDLYLMQRDLYKRGYLDYDPSWRSAKESS